MDITYDPTFDHLAQAKMTDEQARKLKLRMQVDTIKARVIMAAKLLPVVMALGWAGWNWLLPPHITEGIAAAAPSVQVEKLNPFRELPEGLYYKGEPLQQFKLEGIGVVPVPEDYAAVRVSATHGLNLVTARTEILSSQTLVGGPAIYNRDSYGMGTGEGYRITSQASFSIRASEKELKVAAEGEKVAVDVDTDQVNIPGGKPGIYLIQSPWDPASAFLIEIVP